VCEYHNEKCPTKCWLVENVCGQHDWWYWNVKLYQTIIYPGLHKKCQECGVKDKNGCVVIFCNCEAGKEQMKEIASPRETYCENCGTPARYYPNTKCRVCGMELK
jgi:hypothetical protein